MRHAIRTTCVFSIMLAALCIAGCATTSVEERPEIDRVRVFFADYDTVWAQLLAAVTTGEEKLSMVDKSTGFISFQKNITVKQLEHYAFDDSGMLISYAVANMVIKARPVSPERTRVEINTKFTATGKTWLDVILSRERQLVLDSKGWLEREYFDRLSATLKGIPVKPDQSAAPRSGH
jgi:hypothetical protein